MKRKVLKKVLFYCFNNSILGGTIGMCFSLAIQYSSIGYLVFGIFAIIAFILNIICICNVSKNKE